MEGRVVGRWGVWDAGRAIRVAPGSWWYWGESLKHNGVAGMIATDTKTAFSERFIQRVLLSVTGDSYDQVEESQHVPMSRVCVSKEIRLMQRPWEHPILSLLLFSCLEHDFYCPPIPSRCHCWALYRVPRRDHPFTSDHWMIGRCLYLLFSSHANVW